mmetsp:Transcript_36804/g.88733  ORF Transcript_36804/g.88733 Transcript_36804/m.88733 type:complete len:252 (-) Transcript_36804:96-851(-)
MTGVSTAVATTVADPAAAVVATSTSTAAALVEPATVATVATAAGTTTASPVTTTLRTITSNVSESSMSPAPAATDFYSYISGRVSKCGSNANNSRSSGGNSQCQPVRAAANKDPAASTAADPARAALARAARLPTQNAACYRCYRSFGHSNSKSSIFYGCISKGSSNYRRNGNGDRNSYCSSADLAATASVSASVQQQIQTQKFLQQPLQQEQRERRTACRGTQRPARHTRPYKRHAQHGIRQHLRRSDRR